MTRALTIIEDAREDDDSSARSIDRLARPRHVDELAQLRAAQPPMGEGTYRRICVECGYPFMTEAREAVLCDPCDQEDADRLGQGWDWHAYPARRFRRGQ